MSGASSPFERISRLLAARLAELRTHAARSTGGTTGLTPFHPGDNVTAETLAACGISHFGESLILVDTRGWTEAVPARPRATRDLDLIAPHQWQRYGQARDAPNALRVLEWWRLRLCELAAEAGDHTLLWPLAHSQPARDDTASRYEAVPRRDDAFTSPMPISADAFVTLAASTGLFCAEPPPFVRGRNGVRERAIYSLARRDFSVRFARASDLPALHRLEKLCWIQPLQTTRRSLLSRIKRYPEGQFVLERDGEVKGVIYSQRIRDERAIAHCTMDNVHALHDPDGDVVQLLAVNIDPEIQQLACGDQLLEFMLQRSSLQRDVRRIVAVTLCKDFRAEDDLDFEAYATGPGRLHDRILHFHHAHGAVIAAILPGYRPRDAANLGNGVLVAYDPMRQRVRMVGDDAVPTVPAHSDSGAHDADRPDFAATLAFVMQSVAALVGDEAAVDPERPLMESGLDSAGLLTLKSRIEARFGRRLKPSFFFTHNTPRKVVEFHCPAATGSLSEPARGAPAAVAEAPAPFACNVAGATGEDARDIAIVGVACRLPGGIDDLDALWRLLDEGREAISAYPTSRGTWPRGDAIERGGFLHDVECFDAAFFRMSPSEAEVTDPQQRLLLEASWSCFEDACMPPAELRGSDTGVFVGASNSDYAHLLQAAGVEAEAHTAVGNSLAVLANRLSYFYDFNGPSLLVDTACSASLVALHTAVRALRAGECGLALACGVNVICNPRISASYARAGMLAPDGRCKVFDDAADGYVRAEGAVVMLLKPLAQALADGNRIHAVVRGTAVNHGGQAAGLTVPNPQRQAALLQAAWRDARIAPQDLSYLEAHGTGTSLGDPVEVEGMQSAFAATLPVGQAARCGIGSIKSNLGHLESAAGLAGVLKVVAAMARRRLPASLHVRHLNTRMSFEGSPLHVQVAAEPWLGDGPRIAGVSSFGSGGANGHVVLCEAPPPSREADAPAVDGGAGPFVASAPDEAGLRRNVRAVLDWLSHRPEGLRFADALHSWQSGRTAFRHRLAVYVRDFDDLAHTLERWLAGDEGRVRTGRVDGVAGGTPTEPDDLAHWRDAIAARDGDALADLWVQGRDGGWSGLHVAGTVRPRFAVVPGHAFERTRYWIEPPATGVVDARAAETRCLVPGWTPQALPEAVGAPEDITRQVLVWTRRALDAAALANGLSNCRVHVIDAAGDDVALRFQALAARCFSELQDLVRDGTQDRVQLQIVAEGDALGEWVGGLRGMLASARIEEPRLAWQILSVPDGLPETELRELLEANQRAFECGATISYRDGRRLARCWNRMPMGDTRAHLSGFRAGGTYLITGGLGGLGRVFAREILETVPDARVILTGRSEPDARTGAILEEWPVSSRPDYRKLDLECREDVDAFADRLREEGLALRGVLHCAGLVEDGYLLHKTGESLARVFGPKVVGTRNLDEATRAFDLDFFVLFSSVMAEAGNAGQTDYACANGFMDCYAAHRQRLVADGMRRGRSLAIAWPYWQEGGMRIEGSALAVLRETRGMEPMPTAAGLDCFRAALRQEASQCLVLHGDQERLQAQIVAERPRKCEAARMPDTSGCDMERAALEQAVLDGLTTLVSEQLKIPAGKLDPDEELARYGLDSIFINRINLALDRHFEALSRTLFFQYRTVADVAGHLLRQHPAQCRAWVSGRATAEAGSPMPVGAVPAPADIRWQHAARGDAHDARRHGEPGAVAIIGMSGLFPQAADVDAFWRNLAAGRDCVTEVPAERWDLSRFHEADPERAIALGRSYGRHGAFVDNFDRFDPMFFGIPPREAAGIDPHERLFLQEAWRAMEDAGYSSDALRRRHQRRVGVFVGVTKTEFELNGAQDPAACGRSYPRTSFSSIANRLSFFLDLAGPSMPIDTMCSSSLVAIHQACEQIRSGACEAAFAGAVNLYLHPSSYYYLSALRMLAPDGRCRSFGEGGSGFVPGEGAAVLLLKSLDRALADGDHVHGVILASHVNHGGRTNGFMVPNPRAQASLVRETLDKAGVSARHVGYIEAHGTGTALGDPIEIDGLQQAFAHDTGERGYCAIGSAKSSIGHLEAAAGIAGVVKVLLQMRHRQIAPSLYAERVNPNIRFDSTAFALNRTLRPWEPLLVDGRLLPRIAGVSSFGAGGVNAHVLLREYETPQVEAPAMAEAGTGPWLVPLSALRREQLLDRAKQLRDALDEDIAHRSLDAIAYTLQVGRDAMAERVAFVIDSIDALRAALEDFILGRANAAVHATVGSGACAGDPGGSIEGRMRLQREVDEGLAAGARFDAGRLAALWVEGASIDWERLYTRASHPRRLSLPTYPFARERYWHERLEAAGTVAAAPVAAPVDAQGDVLLAVPTWLPLDLYAPNPDSSPAFDRQVVLLATLGLDAGELALALSAHMPAGVVLDCVALASPAQDAATHYADIACQCFERLRALALDPATGRVLVQCVINDEGDGQMLRGLSALLRTLSSEHARFTGQLVGVSLDAQPTRLASRLHALAKRPQAHLVRCRRGCMESLDWERQPLAGGAPPAYRDQGVYVVTGGMGALGRVFVADILARSPRATVVVTGRGPLNVDIAGRLEALGGNCAGLAYRQLDLLDATAVATLFDELRERHGDVHGILHCAGMIDDRLIVRKTSGQFAATLQPKVAGTVHLDRASRGHALDFFVVFSSIASAMGSIGQADYATANGFMDHFVQRRRERVHLGERRGKSIAVHWPYWREGGMRIDASTQEVIAQSIGMRPMETAIGLDVFHRAVSLDHPRILVAQGDPARFLACLRGVAPPSVAIASEPADAASVAVEGPVVATAAADALDLDRILDLLRGMLAEVLQARPGDLDPRKPLVDLGVDSVLGTEFVGAINRRFSTTLSSVGIYDHPSLLALAQYVEGARPKTALRAACAAAAPPPATRIAADEGSARRGIRDERIAVVGMSGRYPQAKNLDAYWRNLVAGRNAIVEIPDSRWDTAAYYDPDPDAEGRMYSKWMGVLDDVDAFDPRFFRITPQEALYMDPEQRLFLQEGYRALEDAGYAGRVADGLDCGVYLGMESSEYGWHFADSPRVSETITGNHSAIAAARLAYFLNLKGPSIAVDTACSSSLVAVHLACQALRGGEIDMALAGGVRLWLSPVTHIGMSKARMLSPTGQCRSFDDAADGIVMGEGVGAVVLKRLSDAERDGDAILGVILASGINQDGRTNGITAPSVKSQVALERRIYREHGIDPAGIGYVEAHGTGTRLGDPIELQALSTVFREHTARERFCALGSVKTNIGHTAAASGVASLHKVLLCLRHGHLVPSLNIGQENRHFDFEHSPFYVNRAYAPWAPGADGRRRAAISSFGFSGTNAHLVIEEYVAPRRADAAGAGPSASAGIERLILLSARTGGQLEQRARELLHFIETDSACRDGGDDALQAIAQTLQLGRAAMEERAAFVARTLDDLRAGLRVLCSDAPDGVGVRRGRLADDDGTLGLWNTDEDLRATAEKWLQGNQLSKLVGLWIKGVDFDWRGLQGNARIARIRLPTYPFAEERYWIDRRARADADRPVARAATGLHPLVHANVSDLGRQAYRTVLRPDAFLLDDHRVHGVRVLPGVACLEMARAAVGLALPEAGEGHLEIIDHAWLRPVVVDAEVALILVLFDEGEDADGTRMIDYEILDETDQDAPPHARGVVLWRPAPPVQEIVDVDALGAAIGGQELGPEALYPRFDALGLRYGARMRGIVGARSDGQQLLAKLRLPEAVMAEADRYGLHPAMMDSAMQCTIRLLAGFADGTAGAAMPFSIDALQVHAPTEREMWAWVRPAEASSAAHARFDIDLMDEEGVCCVRLRGLSSRAIPQPDVPARELPEGPARAAKRPSLRALQPIWNPMRFGADVAVMPPGRCLLIGGGPEAAWLRQAVDALQTLELERDVSVEAIADALATHEFDHVLWFAPEVGTADDVVASQDVGVLALFRLFKALASLERHEHPLDLTIVTRNAVQVSEGDAVSPHHAGVHGLVGSVAKEMPAWRFRLADIASTDGLDPRELLALPWDDRGDGLVHRRDEWFRQEFADVLRLPRLDAVCRHNGTYVVVGGAGGLGEVWTRHMVERYDANVVWIGRRAPDAAIEAKLDAVAALGRRPLYIAADAADEASLAAAIERVRTLLPRIDGVVHSALVLQDQSVRAMDEAVFRRSLAAKVDVSVNLERVFRGHDLDFMLFFSSVSSYYRGAGQSNYCAGCTFKDSFAQAMRAGRSWPVKIVNWGYWGSVGIVSDPFYRKRMESLGFGSIQPKDAMDALEYFLASDMQQLSLIDVITDAALDDLVVSEEVRHYPGPVMDTHVHRVFGVAS